jgi:hypothetical protein
MNFQAIVVEQWTPGILLMAWGIAQSLILEYAPGVSDWYSGLDKQWKRFSQAIGLFLVSVLVLVLACTDVLGGIACDQGGAIELFTVFILGLISNQTTHLIVKKDSSP